MTDKQILQKYFISQDYDEDEIGKWITHYFCKYCKDGFDKEESINHYKKYKSKCNIRTKSDKQILQKAIERAESNGFIFIKWWSNKLYKKYGKNYDMDFIKNVVISDSKVYINLIFNHDFAICFWGIEQVCEHSGHKFDKNICWLHYEDNINCYGIENYKYHLQQMILEKEPLKYLEKFLKD